MQTPNASNQKYQNLSYWHDSASELIKYRASLNQNIQADVAIVGAGYTGLWTAYYLKKNNPSLDIIIVEAEIAGFGASGRNGGWCSSYLSGIDQWLDDPKTKQAGVLLQRLMFETVREVGRVTKQESIDCHFDQSGALEIAVLPVQLKKLREELEYVRGLGFEETDYRWLDADELRGLVNVDQALAGIHMQHCAAIHPFRLARGLADTLENLGVSIYENSPVLEIKDKQVITRDGVVNGGAVVVATEGYSASIANRKRLLIPVHSMMVATEPLSDQQLEDINFKQRFCFGNLDRLVTYGQLTADRRIAFGCRGSYHYGSGVRAFDFSDPEFNLVSQSLLRFFPSLEGVRFTHGWGGTMGVSRSLKPSVNFDSESRIGWAGGFFGNGVGATHLAGQTMADLVMGEETDRTRTPWVNPDAGHKKWEPEPVRWLGIHARATLMRMADQAEHSNNRLAPLISKTLETLFP